MTLRCLAPLMLKFDGRPIQFEPGSVFTVTPAQGARVLAKFPAHVEMLTLPSEEPLQPGWLVSYRDHGGALRGGCDDRAHGTVEVCRREGPGWTVLLTDGQRLPVTSIRGVTKSNGAAWTVREHGYDGQGSCAPEMATDVPDEPPAAPAPLGTVLGAAMDWRATWRELAALTYGITPEDPRLAGVMAALHQCDAAYRNGNGAAFRQAAEQVRRAMTD